MLTSGLFLRQPAVAAECDPILEPSVASPYNPAKIANDINLLIAKCLKNHADATCRCN
jgi:hypothetical protein